MSESQSKPPPRVPTRSRAQHSSLPLLPQAVPHGHGRVSFGLTPYTVAIKIANRTLTLDPALPLARQRWFTWCVLPPPPKITVRSFIIPAD